MTTILDEADSNDLNSLNDLDLEANDSPPASPEPQDGPALADGQPEETLYSIRTEDGWCGPFTAEQLAEQAAVGEINPMKYARIVAGSDAKGTERRIRDVLQELQGEAPDDDEQDADDAIEVLNFSTTPDKLSQQLETASAGLASSQKMLDSAGYKGAAKNAGTLSGALGAAGTILAVYSMVDSIFNPQPSDFDKLSALIDALSAKVDKIGDQIDEGFRRVQEDLSRLFRLVEEAQRAIEMSTKRTALRFTADALRVNIGTIGAVSTILANYMKDVTGAAKGDSQSRRRVTSGYWVRRMRAVSASDIFHAAFQLSGLCKAHDTENPVEMNLFQDYYQVTYGDRDGLVRLGDHILAAINVACIIDGFLMASVEGLSEDDALVWAKSSGTLYQPLIENVLACTTYWADKAVDEDEKNIKTRMESLIYWGNVNDKTLQSTVDDVYRTLQADFSWLTCVVAGFKTVSGIGPATPDRRKPSKDAQGVVKLDGKSYCIVIAWRENAAVGAFNAQAAVDYFKNPKEVPAAPTDHTVWIYDKSIPCYKFDAKIAKSGYKNILNGFTWRKTYHLMWRL